MFRYNSLSYNVSRTWSQLSTTSNTCNTDCLLMYTSVCTEAFVAVYFNGQFHVTAKQVAQVPL